MEYQVVATEDSTGLDWYVPGNLDLADAIEAAASIQEEEGWTASIQTVESEEAN
jgi:hypothetical protein